MKWLFLACFVGLSAAGVVTLRLQPANSGKIPVLYWVTDNNPARQSQVKVFREWIAKYHPDQAYDIEVDSANADATKRVIECVSGVGDDLVDLYGGGEARYFQQMGVLRDVTDDALRLGFGPDQTWQSLLPQIMLPTVDHGTRQFLFPTNFSADQYMVNLDTFRRYDLPPPPARWSFDDFERIGKQFVDAANPNPRLRTVFFADSIPIQVLRRSLGLSTFDETGTHCVLNFPQNVAVFNLDYRWTYVDHLLPTLAEQSAATVSAGFGGAAPQLFQSGNYALLWTGRYMVDQFRQFHTRLNLAVSEAPSDGFRNAVVNNTRGTSVYAGGKHQELALYFLQFLASKEYNMEIIDDGDALPPNPKYADTEAYLHPPDHPEDWSINAPFAYAGRELAISDSYSPFVLDSVVKREDQAALDKFMNGLLDAPSACQEAADRINDEIKRTLHENPQLQPLYDRLCARQKQIDALKSQGKKIPLDWLEDPFYRKYYQKMGWTR